MADASGGYFVPPTIECFPVVSASVTVPRNVWVGDNPIDYAFPLLAVQLFLIVTVTWTLHFLLKPLKQPKIVSEILGGILLGPSFFCRDPEVRHSLFPKHGEPLLDILSSFGLTYVIFLIGVKFDAGLLKRAGTKSIVIGLFGLLVPFTITLYYCNHTVHKGISDKPGFHFRLATSMSITSFAVIAPIISELNLLNSELGQIAMSASVTNDLYAWAYLTGSILSQASSDSPVKAVWAFCSMVVMVALVWCIARPMALWVISVTPSGQPVSPGYAFVFLLIVLVVGVCGDIIGTSSFHGALLLGLVIPEGPPLGATLVEKTESIVTSVMMPLYYALMGLNTDVWTVKDWHALGLLIFWAMLGKLAGILLPSLYYGIPIRDALSLSLFMNSKGIVEVMIYNLWRSNKMIDEQTYTVLMLAAVAVTAVVAPLATVLYEPSRRYTVYKRRTVEHLKPGGELRIVACVHDDARVPGIINLLEATQCATSPLAVYALHLVELAGHSAPVFIPHSSPSNNHSATAEPDHIANAFLLFEKRHRNHVTVHPFTAISAYASMHDEICRLAVEKRTSLIVMPFHKICSVDGMPEVHAGLKTVNKKVLASAPCSVGVLVEAAAAMGVAGKRSGEFAHDVVVFFFGGADDREALALGTLMAVHPEVGLTVVRFLPSRSIRDDQAERKLDCRAVEEFRASTRRNERITYREALVRDMEEIVSVIMDESSYDLVIVGMRHVSNSVVSEQLAEMSDSPDLGVIGDILSSPEAFEAKFSVLVIKQQDEMGLHPLPSYHSQNPNETEILRRHGGVGVGQLGVR